MPQNAPDRIPFGLADITIGSTTTFSGAANLQADGGELSIKPILEEVTIADFGKTIYDYRVVGYEVELKIVIAETDAQVVLDSFSYMSKLGTTNIGYTDESVGKSLRAKAQQVVIHPRQYAAAVKDDDVTIFKAVGVGDYVVPYKNEQGKVEVSLKALVKDNADPSKVGNIFYVGATAPA
ncbi:major tail protein [Bacillus phage vB_BceS-M2]|nr:hypothetical protein PBC5_023 [Bacillus phage PBC5]